MRYVGKYGMRLMNKNSEKKKAPAFRRRNKCEYHRFFWHLGVVVHLPQLHCNEGWEILLDAQTEERQPHPGGVAAEVRLQLLLEIGCSRGPRRSVAVNASVVTLGHMAVKKKNFFWWGWCDP